MIEKKGGVNAAGGLGCGHFCLRRINRQHPVIKPLGSPYSDRRQRSSRRSPRLVMNRNWVLRKALEIVMISIFPN